MSTKSTCANKGPDTTTVEDVTSYQLYSIKNIRDGSLHIGFFTHKRDFFIILCGGCQDELGWNSVGSYDLKTLKKVVGAIKVILE